MAIVAEVEQEKRYFKVIGVEGDSIEIISVDFYPTGKPHICSRQRLKIQSPEQAASLIGRYGAIKHESELMETAYVNFLEAKPENSDLIRRINQAVGLFHVVDRSGL
jgi:hypothetical protein